MGEHNPNVLSRLGEALAQSSYAPHSHHYPNVSAHGNAQLHLGDLHYHGILSDQSWRPDEIKAFGLCLGPAPQINPTYFVGRASELSTMNNILHPQSQSIEERRLVLVGMGGIGKTQLAIAYAKEYRHFYRSVFWLNATSGITLKASFRLIMQRITQAKEYEKLDETQIVLRVREWLSDTRNTQWLLIFDNYDDPDQLDIEEYYPYAAHGSIITTTRLPDLVRGSQVRVQPLQHIEEGLDILQTRSQRDNIRADGYAWRLAKRLDGPPLALATAGAYLRKSTLTFERYLQEYEKHWNIDPRRPLKLQEYQNHTLYTTWDLSYTRLEANDPCAAQILRLLAYFDNQKIWYELLDADCSDDLPTWLREWVTDPVGFASVMGTLVDYCLVEVQTATQSYSMHTCVQDWALASLNKTIDVQSYWYAFDCVAKSIHPYEWLSLGHVRHASLVPHAVRLTNDRFIHQVGEVMYNRIEGAVYIAELLRQQVQLAASTVMYKRALVGYEKALGPEHALTLLLVNNIGILYHDQGRFDEAEQMYNRALAGQEKALGPNHSSTLTTVHNLGSLYRLQIKLNEAEEMFKRALEGKKKVLGPNHISTLNTFNEICLVYHNRDKFDDGEQAYKQVLLGKEEALGPDHISTLTTVHNLSSLHRDQGKLNEAERMLNRALTGIEKALGPDHTLTLTTVGDLGLLYHDQDKLDKAEQMYNRALAGTEKALGLDHPLTLRTVNNLGLLYYDQGKPSEAAQMYNRAVARQKEVLGPNHLSSLTTINNLGVLYHDQGQLDEAEQMYKLVIAEREKIVGSNHTSTLTTADNLGNLYRAQGKLDNAEQTLERVLVEKEKVLGQDHLSTLTTAHSLGLLYYDQDKLKEAEQMLMRALVGKEKALGSAHSWTLAAADDLGLLYHKQNKLEKAEQMFQRARGQPNVCKD